MLLQVFSAECKGDLYFLCGNNLKGSQQDHGMRFFLAPTVEVVKNASPLTDAEKQLLEGRGMSFIRGVYENLLHVT
jgi:hypothetical protein